MSTTKQDDGKEKTEIEQQTENILSFDRSELWSRDWCPFCGKKDCKSKLHFLKLYTLPMATLSPKLQFLLRAIPFGIFMLLLIGGKILYLMFTTK